jgi:hypothetical protein
MLDKIVQRPIAVSLRIFDLRTNLRNSFPFPTHFTWREMPICMSGHATRIKVCVLMAGIAAHAPNSKAISASDYGWLVQAARITLTRRSAGGMTIDATCMGEHLT